FISWPSPKGVIVSPPDVRRPRRSMGTIRHTGFSPTRGGGLCAALHGALAGAWAPSEIAGWLYARIASTLAPTEGQGRRVENRVAFSTESPNTQRTLITQRASLYGKKSPGAIHLRSFFVQVPSMQHPAELSPLGKSSAYVATYSPQVLFPIPRAPKWAELGVTAETLPYQGVDIWNCYELSWLLPSGKP